MELIEKKRCVIVAAGVTESEDILKQNIYYDDFVIAADAGYTKLKKTGIEPDLIVGDFDSSDTPENDTETIVLSPIKDCTDTEYALGEAQKRGFDEILVLGALGGRIDHSIANIILTARFKQNGISVTLADEHHRIYALCDETKTFVKSDRYISVYAFAEPCEVCFEGFYYGNGTVKLSPFDTVGTSNEITDQTAKLTVSKGIAVIIESSIK